MTFNLYESMMEHFERFGLLINNQVVRTPVAIASMAGYVDAEYVRAREKHIGLAFIGGYSIDEPAMRASVLMASDGREEFIREDMISELRSQVSRMAGSDVCTWDQHEGLLSRVICHGS